MYKYFRFLNLLISLVMVVALFGTQQPAAAKHAAQAIDLNAQYAPGQVVVMFEAGQTPKVYADQASALAGTVGAMVVRVNNYGTALLQGAPDADVAALVQAVSAQSGVKIAEPNYIFKIPESQASVPNPRPAPNQVIVRTDTASGRQFEVPVTTLKALKVKNGSTISATYPNDKYLWDNFAYTGVRADIVWPNTTASKNICEIDTGVDYNHPDLAGQIIKGFDYVNWDSDPMDDNGHGTHVAGIIVAKQNNSLGIAGIAPNAKIVAMKALTAQGIGFNFDISQAIRDCANRTDISIINMSLNGPFSMVQALAVDFATNTKDKLIVAAAGNDNTFSYCMNDNGTPNNISDDYPDGDVRTYPAGFADAADVYSTDGTCTDTGTPLHPAYAGVISVGATGVLEDTPKGPAYDYYAKADYTNYGAWVYFLAPGTDILSTTPYDRPFYLNTDIGTQGQTVAPRYDYLSGTSMATAAASATLARAWGYRAYVNSTHKPSPLPPPVAADVWNWVQSYSMPGAMYGWPTKQHTPTSQANVAMVLERSAAEASAVDATTGLPLPNATFSVYQGTSLKGSAVFAPTNCMGNELAQCYPSWTDILNLPALQTYTPKIMATNYTAAATDAFVGDTHNSDAAGAVTLDIGGFTFAGTAAVPPKSANFSLVPVWTDPYYMTLSSSDLDLITYLPTLPKSPNDGQPSIFEVSMWWHDYGFIGGTDPEGVGSLGVFPFARHMFESVLDKATWNFESTIIRNRWTSLGVGFPANAALPYYTGTYEVFVTDYGQFIDSDGNGSLGPGELPLLSAFDATGSGWLTMFVWKDGVMKAWPTLSDTCSEGEHMWHALDITSAAIGAVTITPVDDCTTTSSIPSGYLDPTFDDIPVLEGTASK